MPLHSEIFEQPRILSDLLVQQWPAIQEIARQIRSFEIDYIFLVARGTSDNAARYAQYLLGASNGLPIALATPSLFTLYEAPPRLKRALVIGISQSGKSPDIVRVLAEGRSQGCPTLAITNAIESDLNQAAAFHIDIQAGLETAVAATKSYTAQLMAIAMLSAALNEDTAAYETLLRVPTWIEQTLRLDDSIMQMAERYRYMNQCVVIGRGFNYSTAFEWSLKLKELTYVVAEPYSSADFQHGPIAVVDQGFPVLAVMPEGRVFVDLLELIERLHTIKRAELLIISNQPQALGIAQSPVRLPAGLPEWVSPMVAIVPAQLFCYHLTRAKGYDTEAPRGLHKVTETH
jgi:glucosamine--fructose-6-phosphate aminotransferase (isomerizing)